MQAEKCVPRLREPPVRLAHGDLVDNRCHCVVEVGATDDMRRNLEIACVRLADNPRKQCRVEGLAAEYAGSFFRRANSSENQRFVLMKFGRSARTRGHFVSRSAPESMVKYAWSASAALASPGYTRGAAELP